MWNRGKDALTIQPLELIAQLEVVTVVQRKLNVVGEFAARERGG